SVKSPWTPYSWLGELGMKWLWDHAGLRGAVIVQSILEAGLVLLVTLCCLERTGREEPGIEPLFLVVIAVVFATFLALPYLSFRPVLAAIDLLALAALLLLRDRRLGETSRAVWALPVIAALCINIHIFAVFVPIWVGALLAGAAIERD